jgi:AcrR family transcriptional regulator
MSPREQLLRKCLRYFLEHGVANLSLRPLANAVGTSARMLVHHFGSKEGLITAVMEQVCARLQSLFEPLITVQGDPEPAEVMLAFWRLTTSKKYRPFMRLLFEVQILAIQNPARYERYLIEMSSSWLKLVQRIIPKAKRSAVMATLSTAVIDGLMLEYLSTGDLSRTSRAVELYLELLGNHQRPRNTRGTLV